MPEQLTVLQVIPRMRAGGAELGCLQVAEALVKNGHRALVASEGGQMVSALEAVGARHLTLPLASKNPAKLIANVRRLACIIRDEQADIIHARSRAPAWSALFAARKTGVGFVTTYHSEYSEKFRLKKLYNSVMARSDVVIAVSDYMAHLIRTRYKTPEDRIVVIHRAFDPARFAPALVTPERITNVKLELGIDEGARVLILAGRITPRKAQQHLIEALGLLHSRGMPPVVAVLAGEVEKPDFKSKLEADAKRLGIGSWLRIPGHVNDMPAAYAMSEFSLNISEQEGLPRVAIESQAMGVPLIVSDTGPGREVALTPPDTPAMQATGRRVPYADPVALAAAIEAILGMSNAERKAMGARGLAHVGARFTLERLTSRTLEVYSRVAKLNPRP